MEAGAGERALACVSSAAASDEAGKGFADTAQIMGSAVSAAGYVSAERPMGDEDAEEIKMRS